MMTIKVTRDGVTKEISEARLDRYKRAGWTEQAAVKEEVKATLKPVKKNTAEQQPAVTVEEAVEEVVSQDTKGE